MNVAIQASLDELNAKLPEYAVLARTTPAEALALQADKVGFRLKRAFSQFTPAKGAIRSERLAALAAGGGIVVRPEILQRVYSKLGVFSSQEDRSKYLKSGKTGRKEFLRFGKTGRKSTLRKGKKLGVQAIAVQAEIAARERGRGYVPAVARFRGLDQLAAVPGGNKSFYSRGRFNQLLASAGLQTDLLGASLVLKYGTTATQGGTAISKPRQMALIPGVLQEAAANVAEYIARKLNNQGRSR